MRKIAALVAILVLTLVGGAAVADAASYSQPTIRQARTNAVPNLNMGESAGFTIVDDGSTFRIFGSARGMQPNTSYVSLIYADAACSQPIAPTVNGGSLTLDGSWQDHGRGREGLYAGYSGTSYKLARAAQSVSVRAVTSAVNSQNGIYTMAMQARACAPIPVR